MFSFPSFRVVSPSPLQCLRAHLGRAVGLCAALLAGCTASRPISTLPTPITPTVLAAPVVAPIEPAPRAPIAAAATFDAAWTTIRDQHFDATLNGVDWVAVRDELRTRAVEAESDEELRDVLNEMLSRLGQSHFAIIPGEAVRAKTASTAAVETVRAPSGLAPANRSASASTSNESATASDSASSLPISETPGILGLDVVMLGSTAVVTHVAINSPAAVEGVIPGWVVESVRGVSIAEAIAPMQVAAQRATEENSNEARQMRYELAAVASSMLQARVDDAIRIGFLLPDGSRTVRDLRAVPASLGATQFGNLPPMSVEVEQARMEWTGTAVDANADAITPTSIGVVRFNIWMPAASQALDLSIDALRDCDGIVLDLRANPGGVGAMAMGLAGHFLKKPRSLGTMSMRETTLEFKTNPRRVTSAGEVTKPYSRPLAILVDSRSASTSEVFAGGMQSLKRARIFGEVTAGMALPARAVELPNGDVLLHAIANFTRPDGTVLEGIGVIPDEAISIDLASIAASTSHDPVLDAACSWIAACTAAAQATTTASVPTP
ncbi:MAG: hypothetical protein EXS10_09450 [Phycisphaerales bacterium]|nr:hypothetical protein [Phycisphaerales bacterium]